MISYSQSQRNQMDFELGNGMTISTNNGKQVLNLGGYISTNASYYGFENSQSQKRGDVNNALIHVKGNFSDEKLSFLLQMDLTDPYPLLDAWASYTPVEWLKITTGQKQSFSGSRSMMFQEQTRALDNHSLANRTFFLSGRELGLFLESRLSIGGVGLDLGAAVTSGDGRNSFGESSTDFDLGGLKYSGRVTLFPLGHFTGDNDLTGTDFAREKSVKIALGSAFSYNQGASNSIGEGHGDFTLYNKDGAMNYPDYQKLSIDLLMKYQGFTFLAEYINATANNLDDLYRAESGMSQLYNKDIADYLKLGNGLNVQLGYLLKSNWAVDVRYSTITPEWKDYKTLIDNRTECTVGIAKYFVDNRLKIQLLGSYLDTPDNVTDKNAFQVTLNMHVVF
jgi:hypothetical protein